MTVEDRSSDGKKDTRILRVVSLQARIHGPIQRLVLAACIVLALVVVPHTAAKAATSSDGWATQTSGTTSTLYGVWGAGPTDVFAVGENATILHYDGVSWSGMSSGVSGVLFNVWGSSSTDVFAVGENGVICHYDGVSWNAMSSGTTKHLQGVWGTDNESVFAVGYSGTIVQYDGSSWENMTSNTSNHLKCIWGSSPSDLFAAGNGGQVLHYDGVDWSVILNDGHPNFMGIWGSASDNVFAAGVGGMVLNYDGASWNTMATEVSDDLNGVWGASSTDVFTAGLDGTILHYDGSLWAEMDSGVAGSLRAICGFSSSSAFAVGYSGTILHYKEMPPEVTAVSPDQGNQGQTLDVVITGSNLDTVTSVSFGAGVTVNSFHVDDPGQITVNITIVGMASAGTRDVSVTGTYGTDALPGAFTVPSASIASVSPSSGKQGQTLDVAILGANLGRTTSAAFGDGIVVESFTVQSPESVSVSITISVSAAIGVRDAKITTIDGSALLPSAFSVVVHDPAIASVSPSYGSQGEVLDVAVSGVNLDGAIAVSFGDGITVNSFAQQSQESLAANITVGLSASLGTREVTVSTDEGTAVLADAFLVAAEPPNIADVGPRSGKVGQMLDVSIMGTNLGSASSVSLGEGVVVEEFVAAADHIAVSIVISADASLGARDVCVTTDGGTATLGEGFVVYRLPPGVVGVSPSSGKPGQTLDVVISGINFLGTTSVDFGDGISVNSFGVDSDTRITANITVLDGAEAGLRDVEVTTAVGSVSFPGGFNLSVESASRYSSPGSSYDESSSPMWIFMALGGVLVALLLLLLLLMKRKGGGAKAPPSAS